MMRLSTLVLTLSLVACAKKGGDLPAPTEPPPDAPPSETSEPAASTPSAPTTRTTDERLAEAVALLRTGDPGEVARARQLLEGLVRDEPRHALAHYDLGAARLAMGEPELAADAFVKAARLDADLVDAWAALGDVELSLGDPVSALKRYDRGLAKAPEHLGLQLGRARAFRAQGRPADAVDAAAVALRTDARSLEAYDVMGQAWLDQDELALARFVYEKAETVPGAEADASIQAHFGWTLWRQGERYAALERLRRAVELDPEHVPALVSLAKVYLSDRNHADVVPLLEAARERAPRSHGVLMDLGIAYRGVGRVDDARAAWERALDLRPDDPAPLFNLGILLADDLKAYDDAIARFTAYVDAGGAEADRATAYIEDVERERKRAERQREREEARRKREAEKAERERLLKEQEAREAEPASPWTTAPTDDAGPAAPAPEPTPEPTPEEEAPAPAPSPWDTEGGE